LHIAEMHITPIAISDPPLLNAAGLHAPYALRIIVELVSDCGISGLSEIPGSQAVEVALSNAREVVIGRDPCDLNRLMASLDERFGTDGADSRVGSGPVGPAAPRPYLQRRRSGLSRYGGQGYGPPSGRSDRRSRTR